MADVLAIQINSTNEIMATAGADYLVNVWSLKDKSVLFEIREHLGPITFLDFLDDQEPDGSIEETVVSIDSEGYLILTSLDGFILKKFSIERSARHCM